MATRWDSFGGRRATFDYQRNLVADRLALRLNGVYNDGEGARQRSGSDIKGIAAALRWQLAPRTVLDVSFERANQRTGVTHVVLTDNYVDQRWHAFTVELRHEFSARLSGLVALNDQRDTTPKKKSLNDNLQASFGGRGVFIDVTPNLPDPTDPAGLRLIPNPRYEQYYVQHQVQQQNGNHGIKSARGVVVYDAGLPFGITERLIASADLRVEHYGKDVFDETLTAAEIARRGLTGASACFLNNQFYRYHYLSDGNSEVALRDPPMPGVAAFTRQSVNTVNACFDQSLVNVALNALGSYFKGRLHTSLGVSRDRWHQSAAKVGTDPTAGNIVAFLDANGKPVPEGAAIPTFDFSKQWVTNKTYGAVFNVLPWLSLTGAWLESTQFTDNYGLDLNDNPVPGLRGKGADLGVRLNFLHGRINLAYVRFDTTSTNATFGVGNAIHDELNPFLAKPFPNNIDFRDQQSVGDEVELFFSPTPNWTGRMTYSSSSVTFTNFYSLLKMKLAEAQATAQARGFDPLAASAVTLQTMRDTIDSATATGRHTANATTRYMFTEGPLSGLALGSSVRYIEGAFFGSMNVGGTIVVPRTKIRDDWISGPFARYRKKFGRVKWTGQINLNNVFGRVTATGLNVRPQYRPDPRQFILSNSFAF